VIRHAQLRGWCIDPGQAGRLGSADSRSTCAVAARRSPTILDFPPPCWNVMLRNRSSGGARLEGMCPPDELWFHERLAHDWCKARFKQAEASSLRDVDE
jgi:hypothetical protein